MSLSTQIKQARATLGLSQSQAAAAWNVPVKTLQKWEQGIREPQGLALASLQALLEAANGPAAPSDPVLTALPQPQEAEAPEDKGIHSTNTPAPSDPPPPDRTSAEAAGIPSQAADSEVGTADEDDGNDWLPHLPLALAFERCRERTKAMHAAVDSGW